MADYITPEEAIAFLNSIVPNAVATLDDTILASTTLLINERLGFDLLSEETETLYLSGNGGTEIFSSKTPINTLTSVEVNYQTVDPETDTTLEETELVLTGDDINCWFDETSGKIWSIYKFPKGTNNVVISGIFGSEEYTPALKTIQKLLILRHYSMILPNTFKTDLMSEQIANYTYKKASFGRSGAMSLNSYIDSLFKDLPMNRNFCIESI